MNISNTPFNSDDVNVAFNVQGDACAVWVETLSSSNRQIYFSFYRSGKWSPATPIPGQGGDNKDPRVCRGRTTNTFCAVWHDVRSNVIVFSEYNDGWQAPYPVSDEGRFAFGMPNVITTVNNRIAVAWQNGRWETINFDIYGRVWDNGWGPIVNISDTRDPTSREVDLCSGLDSRIMAVWMEAPLTPPEYGIFEGMMNIDDAHGNWGQPFYYTNIGDWMWRHNVAINAKNNILVTYYWRKANHENYNHGYYGSFCINGVWTAPVLASELGEHWEHPFYFNDVCAYNDGFLFIYRNNSFNIAYCTASNGSFASPIELTNTNATYHPSIDYHPRIGALAAWTERGGSNHEVMALVFNPADKPPDPEPPAPGPTPGPGPTPVPTKPVYPPINVACEKIIIDYVVPDVRVETIENRNVFSFQYIKKVTWSPLRNAGQFNAAIQRYKIFRRDNGNLPWIPLADVGANVLEYYDKNQIKPDVPYEYLILAVDQFGNTYYAYNRITWENNPQNASTGIVVKEYHIHRAVPGKYDFGYWLTVGSDVFAFEDRSDDIRGGTIFRYAISTLDSNNKESGKAEAVPTGYGAAPSFHYTPVDRAKRRSPEKVK